MIVIIMSTILGTMIGLGACGFVNSVKNERAIEELKYSLENLKTQVSKFSKEYR
jgi:hypothetical protein